LNHVKHGLLLARMKGWEGGWGEGGTGSSAYQWRYFYSSYF